MFMIFKKILAYIKGFFKTMGKKKYDTLAGSLTFFFLLSVVPILYITLFFYGQIANAMKLELAIPDWLKDYITFDLNVGVSIFFIFATIYSTTKFFVQTKKIGDIKQNNRYFTVPKPSEFWRLDKYEFGIDLF